MDAADSTQMSISVTVYIEHERLALAPTLRQLDDIKIRVISHGNTNPGATDFPFHVQYGDSDRLERALESDPTVDAFDLVDRTGETSIYYIEHTDRTKLITPVVSDVNGYLVHTETRGTGWLVRLLLPDREALNVVWEYARDNDMTLEIIEIYTNEDAGGEGSYGLTDEQRAALTLAYRRGYFDEPRDVSLSEVAEELGLSSTAMSGRLRRGMRNLVAATLADTDEEAR